MSIPESQIAEIIKRNERVEREKAWETSLTRRMSIAVLTYICAVIFLWSIKSPIAVFQALIPTLGYLLSTLSLPWLRRQWIQKNFPSQEPKGEA